MKARFLAFVLVALVAVGPADAAAPIEDPNFNDPVDALMAIQDLQTIVEILAGEKGVKGYADQCDLAVRYVETQAAIYGVPERADLMRGWLTCYQVYRVIAPDDAGAIEIQPAPSIRLDPAGRQPLDAPPGYLEKPTGGE